MDSYAEQQLHVFSDTHAKFKEKLQASRAEVMAKQHKRATPVRIKTRDTVLI